MSWTSEILPFIRVGLYAGVASVGVWSEWWTWEKMMEVAGLIAFIDVSFLHKQTRDEVERLERHLRRFSK